MRLCAAAQSNEAGGDQTLDQARLAPVQVAKLDYPLVELIVRILLEREGAEITEQHRHLLVSRAVAKSNEIVHLFRTRRP